jgi:hypothetical protein
MARVNGVRVTAKRPEWSRPPFESGNQIARTHGAYATVALGPRVAELADEIRPHIPAYQEGDEIALRILCLALARLEASADALGEAEGSDLQRLRQDERGWSNTVRRYLADLGLTPTSRATLGLNVTRARGALAVEALGAHLAAAYGEDGTP